MRRTRRNGGLKTQEVSQTERPRNGPLLQMQELQDILDDQSHKLAMAKTCYVQQNTAIARENSQLKVKLNEMETKVSELIQENMSIRSTLTVAQVGYKKQLSDHIRGIEGTLLTRFQGILDTLHSFQQDQGLPGTNPPARLNVSSDLPEHITRIDVLSSSIPTSKDTHTLPNLSVESPSVASTSSRKRRKSSRRQSMFVPSDFEFPLGNLDNDETHLSGECETGSNEMTPGAAESTEIPSSRDETPGRNEDELPGKDDDNDFTNSIIDYSIPEENDAKSEKKKSLFTTSSASSSLLLANSSMQRGLPNVTPPASNVFVDVSSSNSKRSKSSSKLNIYKDTDIDEVPETCDSQAPRHSAGKHPVNPPRIKSKKRKIVDEIMPTSNYPELTQPARRTRGKSINYALPSLRAKMRRPSEKLVDATTITDINDLQVNNVKRQHKETRSRSPEIEVVESNAISHPVEVMKQVNATVKKCPFNKSSSPLTDKDVNKRRPNTQKKKKLFKPAIVNDLNDENSININDTSSRASSQGRRSVSFRLNEDDLSVFDLIPKKPATPKTYKNSRNGSVKTTNLGKPFNL